MLMVMVVAGVMSVSLENWVAPTGRHLAFLGFAGLFVTFGHIGLLLAFRLGRTASVAPFFYSFALWGVLSGLIIWGTLPNALALRRDRPDRWQGHRHRRARPATWPRGDRADGCAMSTGSLLRQATLWEANPRSLRRR